MLKKVPSERITVIEMQEHPWITNVGKNPCSWSDDVNYVQFQDPTEEEMNQAMTKVE